MGRWAVAPSSLALCARINSSSAFVGAAPDQHCSGLTCVVGVALNHGLLAAALDANHVCSKSWWQREGERFVGVEPDVASPSRGELNTGSARGRWRGLNLQFSRSLLQGAARSIRRFWASGARRRPGDSQPVDEAAAGRALFLHGRLLVAAQAGARAGGGVSRSAGVVGARRRNARFPVTETELRRW